MILSLVLVVASAHAASCDKPLAALKAADSAGVAAAFSDLVACDKTIGESSFLDALGKATDTDALTALAMVAIEKDVWKPMWSSLGKISNYEARDEVANAVGTACQEHPKVVTYLEGAYLGLRDIEFKQWEDAFVSCEDPALTVWIDKQVRTPPAKHYDEKFVELMAIYVKKQKSAALPTLTDAAIAAAEKGPFDAILFKMGEAVQPEMGESITPENQAALEGALVNVASKVDKDKAKSVASQLANSGSDGAAAKLLPVLYGDVADKGIYTYGAASIESGDCGGKKQAFIHYVAVAEPGKRWTILADLEAPLRAEKAKAGKTCTIESPWPIVHSPTPIKGNAAVEEWVKSVQADWEGKGFEVKLVKEKAVTLP